jgi:hypothetical protein
MIVIEFISFCKNLDCKLINLKKPDSELAEKAVPKPVDFLITPDTLTNVKDVFKAFSSLANFYAKFLTLRCDLSHRNRKFQILL